jgi:hypothetical protein
MADVRVKTLVSTMHETAQPPECCAQRLPNSLRLVREILRPYKYFFGTNVENQCAMVDF